MSNTTSTYCPTTVCSQFTAHHSQTQLYTFASKERDEESGLSYFGSRYYSSDLSIWLSVDPMSEKYPSLSPYVYCANNPVKLVDPKGEEVIEVKPPGKLSTFLNNLDHKVVGSAENRFCEGGSDGANQGKITKQDIEIGLNVTLAIVSAGAAAEAETAIDVIIGTASAVNSIDDATSNSSGQTVSQRVTANNPIINEGVDVTKKAISLSATGYATAQSTSAVKTVIKNGKKELGKAVSKLSEMAMNVWSAIKCFTQKRINNETK